MLLAGDAGIVSTMSLRALARPAGGQVNPIESALLRLARDQLCTTALSWLSTLWYHPMMTHDVDGFDLKFTSRTGWKAERKANGVVLDVIPVTWTKGRRQAASQVFQEVWFKDPVDLIAHNTRTTPFVVAVAKAKDYNKLPHEFAQFTAIFEVEATGNVLSNASIETRVIRRLLQSLNGALA
jgi:hypothetical protein